MAEYPAEPRSKELLRLAKANPRNVNETRYWGDEYQLQRKREKAAGRGLREFSTNRRAQPGNVDGLMAALDQMSPRPGRAR